VGTAGHVDHGKTSLVRALTGVETDRWAEERERGLTIDIGFAPIKTASGGDVGLVDVPGHEDFVRNMLAGSTGVDVLLLVVAADEGPMPQTREHLLIAKLLGIRHGVVALNKADRVDEEWMSLVTDTTREELTRVLGHGDWPMVAVSATTGQGMADLRDAIESAVSVCEQRNPRDLFRMPVDRSFSVRGAGTVVTGTTWSGQVEVGDTVRVLPLDLKARVRALQVHGEERPQVGPARRCAMALVGVDASQVERGSVVVGTGNWRAVRRLGVRVEVPVDCAREIKHSRRVRLFLGTSEVMARLRTVDRQSLSPGGRAWAVLDCEGPVVARVGDRFVLRFYSPVTTVAGGQVCSLEPSRGWRMQLEQWAEVLGGEPADSAAAAVRLAGGRGLADADVPLSSRVTAGEAAVALGESALVVRIGGSWYSRALVEEASSELLAHLQSAHGQRRRVSSEPLESVRAGLAGRFSVELIERAVQALSASGQVVVEGPGIRLAEHRVDLSDAERGAMTDLLRLLSEAGLAPPPPGEMARLLGVPRDLLNDILRLLVEREQVIRVTPEIFVTREAEAQACEAVQRVARAGAASPGDFREALGLSRRHLIPLLEHMDRIGVTRRTPEGRVSNSGS